MQNKRAAKNLHGKLECRYKGGKQKTNDDENYRFLRLRLRRSRELEILLFLDLKTGKKQLQTQLFGTHTTRRKLEHLSKVRRSSARKNPNGAAAKKKGFSWRGTTKKFAAAQKSGEDS